jgi:hypothetical protein
MRNPDRSRTAAAFRMQNPVYIYLWSRKSLRTQSRPYDLVAPLGDII